MKNPLVLCVALISLAFLPAGSCNQQPPKPVPEDIDAGPQPDPYTCGDYCGHLSNLQCSEGTNPKCEPLCNKVLEENLIRLPINCVMGATTKEAAIECGADCE